MAGHCVHGHLFVIPLEQSVSEERHWKLVTHGMCHRLVYEDLAVFGGGLQLPEVLYPVRVPILAAVPQLRPRSPSVRGPWRDHTGFSKISLFRPWPQCNADCELCTPLVVFGSLYSFFIAKRRNPARWARTMTR